MDLIAVTYEDFESVLKNYSDHRHLLIESAKTRLVHDLEYAYLLAAIDQINEFYVDLRSLFLSRLRVVDDGTNETTPSKEKLFKRSQTANAHVLLSDLDNLENGGKTKAAVEEEKRNRAEARR